MRNVFQYCDYNFTPLKTFLGAFEVAVTPLTPAAILDTSDGAPGATAVQATGNLVGEDYALFR